MPRWAGPQNATAVAGLLRRRIRGSPPVLFSFNRDSTSLSTSWSSEVDSESMVLIIFFMASFRLRKAWCLTSRSILFRSSSSSLTGTTPMAFIYKLYTPLYWAFWERASSRPVLVEHTILGIAVDASSGAFTFRGHVTLRGSSCNESLFRPYWLLQS